MPNEPDNQPPESEEYFVCSCCGEQILPHTTTSWRVEDGTIVSLAQYADIAAVLDQSAAGAGEQSKKCLCVNCYRDRKFSAAEADLKQIHLQAGRNFQLRGELDAALEALGSALALEKSAAMYAAIGGCQIQAGQLEQAIGSYSTGLALERHNAECLLGGIELFIDTRQFELAEEWLKIAGESENAGRGGKPLIPAQRLFMLRAQVKLLQDDVSAAERLYSAGSGLITDEKERSEYAAQWKKYLSSRKLS